MKSWLTQILTRIQRREKVKISDKRRFAKSFKIIYLSFLISLFSSVKYFSCHIKNTVIQKAVTLRAENKSFEFAPIRKSR